MQFILLRVACSTHLFNCSMSFAQKSCFGALEVLVSSRELAPFAASFHSFLILKRGLASVGLSSFSPLLAFWLRNLPTHLRVSSISFHPLTGILILSSLSYTLSDNWMRSPRPQTNDSLVLQLKQQNLRLGSRIQTPPTQAPLQGRNRASTR